MELIAIDSQLVAPGKNILFTDVVIPGGKSIIHREGSGLINLRGLANGQSRARFRVYFNGNIKADTDNTVSSATTLSISVAQNGEAITCTKMNATVYDTTATFNVAATTDIDVPIGCCTTIAIQNTSTIDIDSLNANIIVERIA